MLRLILVMLPVVVIASVEVCARVVFSLKYGVPGHVYGTMKYDPVLGAVPKANSYSLNAHLNDYGFRNSENVIDPKPADALRVIAYGGSTTYCHHLKNDQAWPIRLQELLRQASGGRDQVLNGGVIMWSLGHSFEKAKRDVPLLKPDAVIIYTGVNEMYNASGLATQGLRIHDLVARREYGRFTTALELNTPFRDVISYKLLRDFVVGPLRKALRIGGAVDSELQAGVVNPDILTNYLETLHSFVNFLREHGVKPVFVKEVFDASHPDQVTMRRLTGYSAAAANVAATWGAVVVDPTDAFHERSATSTLFQETGVHVTVAGANLMASVVYDQAFRK